MLTFLGKILISMIMALVSLTAQAQLRRVVTYQQVDAGGNTVEMNAFTFDSVDEQPHFPGGDGAMMKFINRERRYPPEAYAAGLEGRVLLSFIVGIDGTLNNPEVLRGSIESLNNEALRIVEKMPRWVPGKIGETKVPVYCILAIPFRL